ncbi:MAG: Crp/Fnr family transcriptional regulator [Sphingobacteriaceae bacterium]|nr:Crp/Fnr family transcriptional regulator [Sphingobacteriaceae bacterium]
MKVSQSILTLFEHKAVVKITEDRKLCDDELNRGIFYIKKGAIKIFKKVDKKDYILWIGLEGDVIGLDQVLLDELDDKTYLALKHSEIIFVPLQEIKSEIDVNKKLFSDLLHSMSDFSDQLEQRIVNINQKSVITNFAALLFNLSKLKVNEIVPKIITTKDIANLIGTSTNYVYKTIQKMEDKSIISFKERRLKIINRELLRKLATEGAPD